uniref:Uncharacterized protein n=1 Tax=Aegilops tauschii subsp. strangulata TaxID=200361 RepID=A0A453MHV3_AEGTS
MAGKEAASLAWAAAACSAAAALRWMRAQKSLVKTKSTKKALTEKAITVVTVFMPMLLGPAGEVIPPPLLLHAEMRCG